MPLILPENYNLHPRLTAQTTLTSRTPPRLLVKKDIHPRGMLKFTHEEELQAACYT